MTEKKRDLPSDFQILKTMQILAIHTRAFLESISDEKVEAIAEAVRRRDKFVLFEPVTMALIAVMDIEDDNPKYTLANDVLSKASDVLNNYKKH